MRIFIGLCTVIVTAAAYYSIPEINHWLIHIGVLQNLEVYQKPTWLYFYMVIFITISLIILYTIATLIFIYVIGKGWGSQVKRAKILSRKKYGVTFLYYLFLDEKYRKHFAQEINNYPRRLVEHYEKLNNLDGYTNAKDKVDYIKSKFEAYKNLLGWPDQVSI